MTHGLSCDVYSEALNVLATCQQREVLSLTQLRKLLDYSERFIEVAQCEVEMDAAPGIVFSMQELLTRQYYAQYSC